MDRLEEIRGIFHARARAKADSLQITVSEPFQIGGTRAGRGGYYHRTAGMPLEFNMYQAVESARENEREGRYKSEYDQMALPKMSPDAIADPLAEEAKQILMEREGITEDIFFKAWMHNWLRNLEGFLRRVKNVRNNVDVTDFSGYIRAGAGVTVSSTGTVSIPQTVIMEGEPVRVHPVP